MHATKHVTRAAALALCAMVALATTACGRDNARDDTAAGTVTESVSVTDVSLGRSIDANKRVVDATDDFAPTDSIYAVVQTSGQAANAAITARWTFEDGQVVDETTQTIAPTGPATTEFHISQPGGLPPGTYRVAILLNGQEVETEEFEVKAP
jgi:hypothetical protein